MGGGFRCCSPPLACFLLCPPRLSRKFPKQSEYVVYFVYPRLISLGFLVSYFVPPWPLSCFFLFRVPQMLELLLNAGSNINAQNIVGDAPLHKAALNGRALSTDYLLRSGANVNIR